VSKNQGKGQIIKMLTLKCKVKCHFMKRDDYVSKGDKEQNTFSFLFLQASYYYFCFQNECKKILWRNCKDGKERKYKS
jgi:hypothetical protein